MKKQPVRYIDLTKSLPSLHSSSTPQDRFTPRQALLFFILALVGFAFIFVLFGL